MIIGCISYTVTKNQLDENAKEHLLVISKDGGRKISYFMDTRYQDMELLCKADVFKGNDTDAMQKYITEVMVFHPYYGAVSFIDLNGTIIACTKEELIGA